MPEGAAQPIAVYHIEPEHFGSGNSKFAKFVITFAVSLGLPFIYFAVTGKLGGSASLPMLGAFGWALLSVASLYRWNGAQRYRLDIWRDRFTSTANGKTVTFFPWDMGEVSDIKGPMAVAGLRIRGYHSELFIPEGTPKYEELRRQIEALKPAKR